MAGIMRKSGVHIMGDVPWGTHFCQFYKTKEDLIDILVPYFKAGLENNELCMWVTSEPLNAKEAKEALAKQVKDLNAYITKGQIEILDCSQWYTKSGRFDPQKVLAGWVDKERQALDNGFDGLRLTGNTFWLEQQDWQDFVDYEAAINSVIGSYRMLAVCTYSLDKCSPSEIIDVVSNHEFALVRREHKWEIMESEKHRDIVQALRKSEQKYKDLVERMGDVIYAVDARGKLVSVNEAVKSMFGFEPEQVVGTPFAQWVQQEQLPNILAVFDQVLRGKKVTTETIALDNNGEAHDIEISSTPVTENGKIVGACGIIRDITERKQAEQALKAENDFTETALNAQADTFFVFEPETGKAVRWNKAFNRISGYSDEEISQMKAPDSYYSQEDVKKATVATDKILKGEPASVELSLITKDGRSIPTEYTASLIKDNEGTPKYIIAIGRDITERKGAAEALRESEEKYRAIFEQAADSIVLADAETGDLVEFNGRTHENLGYTRQEFKHLKIADIEVIESPEEVAAHLRKITREGSDTFETKHRTKDGRIRDILVSSRGIRFGCRDFVYSIWRDITDRKEAEQALRESQEKFRNLAEQSPNMIFINSGGRIVYANSRCVEVMGHTREEFYSPDFDFLSMIAPESRDAIKESHQRHLNGQDVAPVEYALMTKTGRRIDAILTTKLIQYEGQNAILGTVTDITDRKHAEQALRESEKQLSTRNSIAKIFLTTPDDEIYAEVLQVVLEAMESRYGIFGYLDENETLIVPSMTRDIWDRCQVPDKTIVYPREKWGGIWGRALEERKTLYANAGLEVPEGHVPITRVLVVPILYAQRRIGLLEVANKPDDYTEKDQRFLEHIAAHIAPILNARLERDKQQRQRRQTEEALRASEQKHRRLVETMNEGLGATDANYFFTYVNDRFCQMLGYSREEVLHRHLLEFIEDEYKQLMEDQITRRRKGESKSYEIGWRAKDGRTIYTLVSPAGQFDDDGNFVGSLGVLTDISERKEVEAQQQLAGTILQVVNQEMGLPELIHEVIALVKKATGFAAVGIRLREGEQFPYFEVDGFSDDFVRAESDLCGLDENGNIRRDASGRAVLECMCGCVLYGRTDASLPPFTNGGSFWTNSTSKLLNSPTAQDLAFTFRGHCNRAGYESVALIPLRSGAEIVGLLQLNDTSPGRFTKEIIGSFEQICTSVGIALARARAEEALKLSEERYALAQRAAHIGSWDWNIITGQLLWSEQIEPMFGFGPGEFGGTYEAFLERVHPEDRQHVVHSVDLCVEQGKDYAIEHRIVWPDGTVRWVSEKGDVIRNETGNAIRMLGVVQDITERKTAEQRLLLGSSILETLNQKEKGQDIIHRILELLKEYTHFDAVGIRLREGDDYPYYEVNGFSEDFVSCENYLCARDESGRTVFDAQGRPILECMCGNVILGRTDPAARFFTQGGSFWTNSTTELLASTSDQERLTHTRNHCNRAGYESVALIPLRSGPQTVGLLQLNDHRRGCFTAEMIRFFEGIGDSIGIALARIKAEEEIESIAKFPSENPCSIVRVQADGAILYANNPGGILLREWDCTVGQHVPKHWHQYVLRILGRGDSQELETRCGDRTFSVLMAPVVDAGYVNLYGIDITERKNAEEDLRQYRQHLEELVEARTAELQETNERLLREIQQRKQLESQLLAISEREKRLIGQELHDSIGQQFTGIAFMTKVLEKRIAGKLPEEAAGAAEITKLVNEAMSQTRVLAKGLHPVDLDAQSPASALQELAATTEHLFGVNCSFTCDKPVSVADATVAINLYRIAQEAVTNAIKHGKAKNIRIALVSNAGQSVLTIKNDGRDFEPTSRKGEGMGLNIMHHRAEIINGSLDIRKGASGGAEVVCTFQSIQS